MPETFGARLRQHRLTRGMSLPDIAEQTKIKASLLEGLERDDISQWPPSIFRRAYLRAYAAAIGYDADAAVREFVELHPDPVEPIDPPSPPARGLRGLVASALGSLRKPAPPVGTKGAGEDFALALPVKEGRPAVALALAPPPRPAVAEAPVEPKASTAEAPDLMAAARLCTELGRIDDSSQLKPLLRDAAKIL